MSILAALQSAALRIAGQRPDSFFGSSELIAQELADLSNEVAEDIAQYQDWQTLTKVHNMTGDGSSEEFDFPDDYDRQLLNADMQDLQSWAWGYQHITDINDFLFQKQRGMILTPGAWIIYGGKMHFTPAPSGDASFPYISRNYALDSASLETKAQFDADTDDFILVDLRAAKGRRLLTLGLIWRWREMKGLGFAGDQEAFTKALDEYASKDAGSKVIRWGGAIFNRRGPWPWVRA